MKYYNNPFLLKPLLPFIKKFCVEHFSQIDIDIITFVPLHWHKLFFREFDQAFLIAESISKILNIPIHPLLFKERSTDSQHLLSKKEREQNLQNTFNIIPGSNIDKKTILLVDDVFTTGNTINECAKILKRKGAKEVYGFTLARGL
jgi:ComF family protein